MLLSPVTSCKVQIFSTEFKYLRYFLYLALDITGFVSVTAAIRRKFLPALLYKPIDRPAVSDEELFAVSGPAVSQSVTGQTTEF